MFWLSNEIDLKMKPANSEWIRNQLSTRPAKVKRETLQSGGFLLGNLPKAPEDGNEWSAALQPAKLLSRNGGEGCCAVSSTTAVAGHHGIFGSE